LEKMKVKKEKKGGGDKKSVEEISKWK
jgi:hypothetical protein